MLKKLLPIGAILIAGSLVVGVFVFPDRQGIGELPKELGSFSMKGIVAAVAEGAKAFTITASSGLEVLVTISDTTKIRNNLGRAVDITAIKPGIEVTSIGLSSNSTTLNASSVLIAHGERDSWPVKPDTLFENSLLPNSYSITGFALKEWFLNKGYFFVRVRDAKNETLMRTRVYPGKGATSTLEYWPFTAWISFNQPTTATGTVSFEREIEKNVIAEKIEVPVRFAAQPGTKAVKLYYQNSRKAEALGDVCSEESVIPTVRNIPETKHPIRDIISLLIRGELTEDEKNNGFVTQFPIPGMTLASSTLQKGGVLRLEFTYEPGFASGGSCRAKLLRAQIEKTAKQFSNIKYVELFPAELFEPYIELNIVHENTSL